MKSCCFYLSVIVAVCLCVTGCQNPEESNWLLVSFEKDVPVTYELTSRRTIQIDLTGGDSAKKNRPQKMSESLTMVISYLPVEVDPFGLTTIQATCLSSKVKRTSMSGKHAAPDAMEKMAGQTFTFQLSPTGEIAEYSDLDRIIHQVGEKAFDKSKKSSGRIKNPDMISDFIAMQWYLWDSVSTIEEPLAGLDPDDTWTAKQLIPWPAPIPNPPARINTYRLDSFVNAPEQPQKAVIKSSYTLSETTIEGFPHPYDGTFQLRGLMGFLRNYEFQSLEGEGTQVFNMENGLIESDKQHYTLKVNASFMLPLGNSKPVLTLDQTISVKQIETPNKQ